MKVVLASAVRSSVVRALVRTSMVLSVVVFGVGGEAVRDREETYPAGVCRGSALHTRQRRYAA